MIRLKKLVNPAGGRSLRGHGRGFTLMEILVALFLFATVVAILSGGFNRVFADIEALTARDRLDRSAAACLEIMCADLHGLYYPLDAGKDAPPEGLVCRPEDERQGPLLQLTSFNHYDAVAAGHPGLVRISYYLEPEQAPLTGFRLMRAERNFAREPFQPVAADAVLCRQLTAITITLLDRDGGEYDTWGLEDGSDAADMPRSVRIVLDLKRDDRFGRYQTQLLLNGGEDL